MAFDRDWWAFIGIYGAIMLLILMSCVGCSVLGSGVPGPAPKVEASNEGKKTEFFYNSDGELVRQVVTDHDSRVKARGSKGSIDPPIVDAGGGVTGGAGASQGIDHGAIVNKTIMTWAGIGLLVAGVLLFAVKSGSVAAPFLAIIPTSACYGLAGLGGGILLLSMLSQMGAFMIVLIAVGIGGVLAFGSGALSNLWQARDKKKAVAVAANGHSNGGNHAGNGSA